MVGCYVWWLNLELSPPETFMDMSGIRRDIEKMLSENINYHVNSYSCHKNDGYFIAILSFRATGIILKDMHTLHYFSYRTKKQNQAEKLEVYNDGI